MPVSPNLPCYMQDLDLVTDLNHVKNGVWIGSHWVLRSSSALLQCGIKHVVNTAIEFITEVPEKVNWKELEQAGISVHNTMWDDTLGEVIFPSPSIEAAVIHMDELVKAGKPVLVNCAMGRSRSASLVIAYFMARHQMSYDKALEMVKAARPQCSPNANFERQLRQLEASLQTAFSNHPNREQLQPQTPTPSVAPQPHANPSPLVSPRQEALHRPSPAAPQPPAAVAPVPPPHTPTRPYAPAGTGSPKEAGTPPSPTPPSFGCSLSQQQQQASVKAASSTRPNCMAPLSPLSNPPAHQSPASAPRPHTGYGQRTSNPNLYLNGLSSPTSASASAGSSGSTAAKLGQYTSPLAQRASGLTSPRTPASGGHYGGAQRNGSGSTGRYGSSGYGRKGLGGAVDSWVPPECRRLSF